MSRQMRHPARFHGAEPFVIETGLPKKKRVKANYTDIFSTVMQENGRSGTECGGGDSSYAGWNRTETVPEICSRTVSLMWELQKSMQ